MPRVLVIAFRALGDMVLITPVVRALKQRDGADSLTLLVDALGAEVFERNPWVDELIVVDRAVQRRRPLTARLAADWALVQRLRAGRFEVCVDLFSGPRSAWLARLSGAPVRYGQSVRGRGRDWLYTHPIPVEEVGRHLVLQKLDIVRPVVGEAPRDVSLELSVDAGERAWAERVLAERGVTSDRPLVGLFPGGGWGHKCWPAERFAALGDRLADAAQVLVVGGVRDREACRAVAREMRRPPVLFDGLTSLRQTMALIARTDVFISNDTGPMHVAVALGRPTIALFGPSDVTKYGPWGPSGVVIRRPLPCSPCPQQVDTCHLNGRSRQECMTSITVDEVADRAERLLTIPHREVIHDG